MINNHQTKNRPFIPRGMSILMLCPSKMKRSSYRVKFPGQNHAATSPCHCDVMSPGQQRTTGLDGLFMHLWPAPYTRPPPGRLVILWAVLIKTFSFCFVLLSVVRSSPEAPRYTCIWWMPCRIITVLPPA